jgi:hypothetical protein
MSYRAKLMHREEVLRPSAKPLMHCYLPPVVHWLLGVTKMRR